MVSCAVARCAERGGVPRQLDQIVRISAFSSARALRGNGWEDLPDSPRRDAELEI